MSDLLELRHIMTSLRISHQLMVVNWIWAIKRVNQSFILLVDRSYCRCQAETLHVTTVTFQKAFEKQLKQIHKLETARCCELVDGLFSPILVIRQNIKSHGLCRVGTSYMYMSKP